MTHRVFAIGHIKMDTQDVEGLVRDATDILGLRVTRETDDAIWLSANGKAAELIIQQASENACHTVGLEALTTADVQIAASRIEAAGCRVISTDPSLDCFDAGVTFATPEGLRFEIHSPARQELYHPRYATKGVGPRRIDHANIISPDPAATRAQLTAIAGMRMSEKLANESLSWMYGGNRQHHILGVVKGTVGLHHYSFEFPDFSMYCKLGDILDRFDRQMMWGPGRHRPGDNTYGYYLDVSNCIVECSGPMALITDEANFEPRIITNLARPGNVREMNVWGTPAPVEWREHHHPFARID